MYFGAKIQIFFICPNRVPIFTFEFSRFFLVFEALKTVSKWQNKLVFPSRDPSYHDKLSLASQGTLINQGGPMSAEEAFRFERHPDFKALLQMRQWDDKAKNKTIPVSSNDGYKELCRDILLNKTV